MVVANVRVPLVRGRDADNSRLSKELLDSILVLLHGKSTYLSLSDFWYPSGLTGVDLFSGPFPRHQFINVGHFVICDAGQNPTQPGFWIDTVHAAGLNERVGDCGSITAAL